MVLIGDCRAILPTLEADSFDACVTDPPYELDFMGRKWDRTGVAFDPETWRAVYRVLRPGARLLAFGGTRTHHRMVCAIEDAGFVIEDTVCWLYGSGFPKHASKLKPAHEPICVAWKPATRASALQIDTCRIGYQSDADAATTEAGTQRMKRSVRGQPGMGREDGNGWERPWNDDPVLAQERAGTFTALGRWPANVVLDEEAAAVLDLMSGDRAAGNHPSSRRGIGFTENGGGSNGGTRGERRQTESGGASRFYYVAKASRSERGDGNDHPTVKPLDLMRWLVRLVTPPNGLILDPFAGSGTTGLAATLEGFRAVLIEEDAHNAEIAERRIEAAPPRQLAMVAD